MSCDECEVGWAKEALGVLCWVCGKEGSTAPLSLRAVLASLAPRPAPELQLRRPTPRSGDLAFGNRWFRASCGLWL